MKAFGEQLAEDLIAALARLEAWLRGTPHAAPAYAYVRRGRTRRQPPRNSRF